VGEIGERSGPCIGQGLEVWGWVECHDGTFENRRRSPQAYRLECGKFAKSSIDFITTLNGGGLCSVLDGGAVRQRR
jgi:hypothetical protein